MTKTRLIISAMLALGCLLSIQTYAADPKPTESASARDGLFIHVTAGPDEAHRVCMALQMASLVSEAGDRDVLLYFDIDGVKALLEDAPDITHKGFEGSKKQLATLMERGVPVYACPGCLKAIDKTADDLAPGVQVANKDAFFAFTKGRILTLDY